jgi:hypothetical protein
MKLSFMFISVFLSIFLSGLALGNNSYQDIAKRHAKVALNQQKVAEAKMQGECLVGLKELNFKKSEDFDPVAEWTTYRSSSLLKQIPPCEVLIIMEVAKAKLKAKM